MRARLHLVSLLLLALFTHLAYAQQPAASTVTAQHLTVQLVVPPAEIYPNQNFTAGLYFKLEPGWHIYWTNAGDSGEPPSIKWTLPQDITVDALQFPAPKRLPLGPLMDFGYEKEVLFPVPVHVGPDFKPSGPATTLAGRVNWLVCREVCIPGKAALSIDRKALAAAPEAPHQVAEDAQLVTQFASTLPKPLPVGNQARFAANEKGFTLAVTTGKRESSAQFFPFEQTILSNPAPQEAKPLNNGIRLTLTKDENLRTAPKELHGLLVLADGTAYEVHATPGALPGAGDTDFGALAKVVGLAFIGGIILNLMPCVFPVLFIKGLSLVQSSQHERAKMRAHGWVYTLGILASFWAVVALLLILRGAGHQLGWGFQFQSPTFIALMALLLFFLGLSLAGQFEIGLSLTSAGGSLANKQGYTGSFFTGVLAMVVATPCTAPFMGAAIGYALSQSALVTFAVFTALALGLAAPYLLLAYNPAWTRLLPRPGAWMEVLKQAVSVPIFGTVIWLVWLFTQTTGPNALIGLLAAFLLLAIAGWVLGRWPGKTVAAIFATLLILPAIGVSIYAVQHLSTPPASTAAAAKDWEPFTPAVVDKYRSTGRPVFIDFTASWCLSCQVNERVVLNRADVQQHLKNSGVALVRADWTRHDETIAQALATLGRSGVPTYVLYSGDANTPPQVLPEVLTPGIVIGALDSLPKTQQQSAQVIRPTN